MDDQKQYGDVFFKDNRNRHDAHLGNKSMGYKEVVRRQRIIKKKKAQRDEQVQQEATDKLQEVQKDKKYGNGKPKKQVKQQQAYIDSDNEDKGNKEGKKVKKVQKQKYSIRR